jgi:hypothetical protein
MHTVNIFWEGTSRRYKQLGCKALLAAAAAGVVVMVVVVVVVLMW